MVSLLFLLLLFCYALILLLWWFGKFNFPQVALCLLAPPQQTFRLANLTSELTDFVLALWPSVMGVGVHHCYRQDSLACGYGGEWFILTI